MKPSKVFCNAIVEEPANTLVPGKGAGMWLLDKETMQVLWVNEVMEEIYGPLEKIQGKHCYEAFRKRSKACEECLPQKASETGNIVTGYISRITRGGIHRHYQVIETPMVDESQKTNRVLEIVLDVTEKIRMEQTIQNSEREHRALFEHAGIAVSVSDQDGKLLKVNQAFENLSGYPRSKIEDKMNQSEFIHPRDLHRITRYSKDRARKGKNPPTSYDFTFLDRKKNERLVQIVVSTMPNGNQICSITDITEQKKLEKEIRDKEQLLNNILRHSVEAIIATDPKDQIRSWNHGAKLMFGYSQQEVLGRKLRFLFTPEFRRSKKLSAINKEFHKKSFIKAFEAHGKTKDGKHILLEITRTALLDENGKEQGSSAILRDVTELRRLERQNVDQEKMVALGEMAASLAHEIKNPLNSMVINLEVLKNHFNLASSAKKETYYRYIGIIESEVKRLDKVMRGVLDFSKPMKTPFAQVDLEKSIRQVLTLVSPEAKKNKITIKTKISENLPRVDGVEDYMKQILLNLTLNSFQAMSNGGVFSIECMSNNDHQVQMHIKDTGCGIPRKNVNRIFDLYFSTKEKGSGLGLPLVKRLVTVQGGSIEFSNRPKGGTQFTLTFPHT